jgi:hypothetical protein
MELLGFLFGVATASLIFLANFIANLLSKFGDVVDIILRLALYGAPLIGLAEIVGMLYGPEVRQHALSFWLSFFLGLVLVPLSGTLVLRIKRRK